jgi:acyl-CoA synthetase (AMP-forming)/AMP-acid ligase II
MTEPSLRDLIRRAAGERPHHPFLESARDARIVRYSDLADAVFRWHRALTGTPDGGPVLLACADPVSFAVAYLGLLASGRLVAPVPASDVGAGPAYDSRSPALLVTDEPGLSARDLQRIVVDAGGRPPTADASGRIVPPQAEGRVLLGSSGTTGPRKGIELSEAALLTTARGVASALELSPSDRGYNPLPLIHVNAEVVGVLATLTAGSTLVVDHQFSRTNFWSLMASRRVTWINAVPAILAILAAPERGRADVGTCDEAAIEGIRLVRSASAPLPLPVLERFERRFGVPVVESYGMTEAASQITSNTVRGPRKPGSVGRPIAVELRVVDDQRRVVPAARLGRVQIRGRSVIRAYVDGAGGDRFEPGGWLDTGDLGRLDEEGYLFLAGRDSEVINRGGEKVFPIDVEQVLLADPDVRAAAVTGRPDPVLGEVPIGFVVAHEPTDSEVLPRLLARCARSLPRRARPVELHLVAALPEGRTGKVLRRALLEAAARLPVGA